MRQPVNMIGIVASVKDSGITVQPFVKRNEIEYVRVVDFGEPEILDIRNKASAGDAE